MTSRICINCNFPNNQDASFCEKCGANVQYYIPVYPQNTARLRAKGNNGVAVTGFVLSLIPTSALVVFALHLAAVNMWSNYFESYSMVLGTLFLMIILGLVLYIGNYIISIFTLVTGIIGRKSERKKLAIAGIIISIFNFSIPFLISPVNELFLR